MSMFELHPRLEKDSFSIVDLPLCHVRLMNNAFFPWLLLIPARAEMREIIDLEEHDQAALMREIALVSRHMRGIFAPEKINVAALGNQVPQLHVHIIARYLEDIAWPDPVWGKSAAPYAPDLLSMMKDRLQPLISAASAA